MSNFNCEHCGHLCVDSSTGYLTGCEHYPADGRGKKFNIGDEVWIPTYNAEGEPDKARGIIHAVAPSFKHESIKFEVHGDNMYSIVSINSLRHV